MNSGALEWDIFVIAHFRCLMKHCSSSSDCNTVRETNMLTVGVRLLCRISQSHGTCQPPPRGLFIRCFDTYVSLARPIKMQRARHVLRRSDIMIDCEPERLVGQRETFVGQHHRDLTVVEYVRDLQQPLRDWFLVRA